MTEQSPHTVFKIGTKQFEIVLDKPKRQIHFFEREGTARRMIGNASFLVVRGLASFSGSMSYPRGRTVLQLTEVAKGIFYEHYPDVVIQGHGVWLRPKGPPVGLSHSDFPGVRSAGRKRPPRHHK